MPDPSRILIRGTNWLGDAVMTTPALSRLREKFREAHITLLTPEKLRVLWLGHPAVHQTISFVPGESVFSVAKKIRQWGATPGEPALARQSVATMAREDQPSPDFGATGARPTGFDLALVLPNSPRSAIEMWLAGIPQRIGYARRWRNFFLTQTVAPRPDAVKTQKLSVAEIRRRTGFQPVSKTSFAKMETGKMPVLHQIYEYLHLTTALGANPEPVAPQLFVTPEEIEAARKKFGLSEIANPIFGMAPGAEYGPAKRWPADRFIAAAREIRARTNCIWLVFGGANDAATAGQIATAIRTPHSAIFNLAGQTSLRELMSLLKLCRILLTNDSGPMHVAAALGTPVVVPFGSTSLELTGPGLPGDSRHRLLKSDAPCSPCFRRECPIDFRCLNGISVELVVAAVMEATSLPEA